MLYLPPRWAHDGVAEGECMTCSIGFRAPAQATRSAARCCSACSTAKTPSAAPTLYRDSVAARDRRAGAHPVDACRPSRGEAVLRLVEDPKALACALGEWLSEPKPSVVVRAGAPPAPSSGLVLDRRTRMLYDDEHVFINGESYRAGGRDAALMRQLADRRSLAAAQRRRASDDARQLLDDWAQAGWLRPCAPTTEEP